MRRDFWKSAGFHLLRRNRDGWLDVTGEYLRAYWTRPEVHPVEESNDHERALHESLLVDPFRAVSQAEINAIGDPDAIETYEIVLRFRDLLVSAGTVEAAYLRAMQDGARGKPVLLPPVFLDQMVHVILRNMLDGVTDPVRLRAAEIFFRDQVVSTEGGRLMLADDEIVEMQAGDNSGLTQLLAETGTPARSVTLDVLDEDNKNLYWDRSDRFDTVVDFRFEQPALDAFARVVETWLGHLLRLDAKVEPRPKLEDADWRWHIGLDAEATRLLNALYQAKTIRIEEMAQIVGLFRMRLKDDTRILERVRGMPIYLGLAMTSGRRVKMKPQNLLINLPVTPAN